ncbi:MAG: flagellar biosynthesis anti-sigma factor FlgM [Lachnospiraceae bacterium]|nr:flagellar biosynthesis anti-sigma factor FlgM [Lachnospiraceae bacterium]
MRIESYIQVQQLYNTQKPKRTQDVNTGSFSDKLQISAQGKDIQTAKQAVRMSPDIRESVIAPIRAQLQNGTYDVSNEAIADKMIEKYNQALA